MTNFDGHDIVFRPANRLELALHQDGVTAATYISQALLDDELCLATALPMVVQMLRDQLRDQLAEMKTRD